MDFILTELKHNPYLRRIIELTRDYPQEIYLVGGWLRDIMLKRKTKTRSRLSRGNLFYGDFDFAVSSQAIRLSREIAKKLKSGFVILDKEHGSTRIIYRDNSFSCNFDFTDFRGKDINEDLLHRDFTVNSLAVNLKRIKQAKSADEILIDNYRARKDIKAKTIRVISDFSLPEDPVRILRAFSLSAVLNFNIAPKTKAAIAKYKKSVTSSAFERITEELFKIMNSENAFTTFASMDKLKVLDEIIPEIKSMRKVSQGPYHHLDVYGHSLETLKQIEILFEQLKRHRNIQDYLNQVVAGTHTKRALLKLGAFLHDIGKPIAKRRVGRKTCFHGHERAGRNIARGIAGRLRLANDERNALEKIIFWHLRPGYMADIKHLSRRAVFKYFRDTQREAVSIILLSIADQRSTRGPLTRGANRKHHEDVCLELAKEFFSKEKEIKLPRLIDGNDVMKHCNLSPGPLIGKVLAEAEESQAVGEITTKAQALALAGAFVKERVKKS